MIDSIRLCKAKRLRYRNRDLADLAHSIARRSRADPDRARTHAAILGDPLANPRETPPLPGTV